jgi:quinol monooxygenase YgiN
MDGYDGQDVMVVARARLRAGSAGRLLQGVNAFVAATRAEPGCVDYDLYVSATAYEEIATVERWRSPAAVEAHLSAPHTLEFLALVAECVVAPPEIRMLRVA